MTPWRGLRLTVWFGATAMITYAVLLLLWYLAALQTGGSPHCDTDCGAIGDFSNAVAPWGMATAILLSAVAGFAAARWRTS